MLVATTTALALRCPSCGKIQYHTLSLFSFSAQKTIRFTCTCGASLLLISTRDRKVFYFQLECLMCEGKHLFQYSLREIWTSQVRGLTCEETGLEVGFLGPREQVKKCIANQERSLREMAEDLGFTDYFANPEIMYEILDSLHKIAEEGNLSCQCGNLQLEVEIFAERVELRCSSCGALGVIDAESREDLEALKNIWEIRLRPGGLQLLGFRKVGRNRRGSKK
ncbi:MAG: hypothetical protein HPY58_03735 [Firmicutes bacterium]|nr:hypothetical protein [Bacillota bacterium]